MYFGMRFISQCIYIYELMGSHRKFIVYALLLFSLFCAVFSDKYEICISFLCLVNSCIKTEMYTNGTTSALLVALQMLAWNWNNITRLHKQNTQIKLNTLHILFAKIILFRFYQTIVCIWNFNEKHITLNVL